MSRVTVIIITLLGLAALTIVGCGQSQNRGFNLGSCNDKAPTNYPAAIDCIAAQVEAQIDQQQDPRLVVPRVDAASAQLNSASRGLCHVAMHKVGRDFAKQNRVTLATLQDYLPPSNQSQCAAGFTHGMISVIGINQNNAGKLLEVCAKEPTRARQASCAHGIGHGLRRTVSGDREMRQALSACAGLGHKAASDCAQGIFHDFYLAVQGQDETQKPPNSKEEKSLCRRQPLQFQAECWYRTTINSIIKVKGTTNGPAERIELICRDFIGQQRSNCIRGVGTAGILSIGGGGGGGGGGDIIAILIQGCSRLNSRDAQACISGAYLLAPGDNNRSPRGAALRKNRLRLANDIVKCVNLPGQQAQEDCFYWMGYLSVRSFANPISDQDARLVCAKLYGSIAKICLRGVDKAKDNDLGPMAGEAT